MKIQGAEQQAEFVIHNGDKYPLIHRAQHGDVELNLIVCEWGSEGLSDRYFVTSPSLDVMIGYGGLNDCVRLFERLASKQEMEQVMVAAYKHHVDFLARSEADLDEEKANDLF